jgi:hypothetical protein
LRLQKQGAGLLSINRLKKTCEDDNPIKQSAHDMRCRCRPMITVSENGQDGDIQGNRRQQSRHPRTDERRNACQQQDETNARLAEPMMIGARINLSARIFISMLTDFRDDRPFCACGH